MKGQSLLFGCCSAFQSVSNQETTDNTLIKSINTKAKKIKLSSLPHSPKSSLRIITSLKTLNNTQNVSGFSSLNLAQTVDHNWRLKSKQQNLLVQQYISHVPVIKAITFQRQQFMHPQLHPLSSNPLLKESACLIPSSQNPKSEYFGTFLTEKNHQISEAEKKTSEKFEHKRTKESISLKANCQNQVYVASTKNNPNNRKDSIQSVLSLQWSQLELGGSKTTFVSESEIENSIMFDDTKMQQSQILINVFNPSNSQIQKWNVSTINKSHH